MDPQAFIEYLSDQRLVVDYAYVSASALLYYDWIINFHDEFQLVWLGKWNYTKVLFMLTRYIPMVDGYFWLHNQMFLDLDPSTCQIHYRAAAWLVALGLLSAEVVLLIRTWAVWGCQKYVGIFLTLLFVVVVILDPIFAKQYLESIVVAPLPFPGFRGCRLLEVSNIIFVNFILLTVIDIVVFVLMCISAWRSYRLGSTDKLSQVVHQDGIHFYVYLLAFTLANIVVSKTLRPGLVTMLTPFLGNVYSIFSCRIILNIRTAAGRHNSPLTEIETDTPQSVQMLPLQFRHSGSRRKDDDDF